MKQSSDELEILEAESTASSTCEAETISMATALKSEALPLIELFNEAMNRRVMLECRDMITFYRDK